MEAAVHPPTYPIPIFQVSRNHYYLYDPNTVAHLRSHHRIAGVLTGTLPQSPQQNVFSGLPLQLMPEEARLLVEKGLAYIVEDGKMHREAYRSMGKEGRKSWRDRLSNMGKEIALGIELEKANDRSRALENMDTAKRDKVVRAMKRREDEETHAKSPVGISELAKTEGEGDVSLFSHGNESVSSTPLPPSENSTIAVRSPCWITPTTSYPPFPASTSPSKHTIPETPTSYDLFKYLHTHPDHTFFISPGLRFGCQYLVYPGDPLRFHSHFLAASWGWNEHIPLLTLVGGGRLGTGVKKGFLIGGRVERDAENEVKGEASGGSEVVEGDRDEDKSGEVRCFTIEWAGM